MLGSMMEKLQYSSSLPWGKACCISPGLVALNGYFQSLGVGKAGFKGRGVSFS